MDIVDSGVMPPSYIDFSIPSEFAKNSLYFASQYGHFYCRSDYRITRESLDLCLLMYICHGSIAIETREKNTLATKDQIVLLNCNYPHTYYCPHQVEFIWFHFTGNSSENYTKYLFEKFGVVFLGEHVPLLRKKFEFILSDLQSAFTNEHLISANIHAILSSLATPKQDSININSLLLPAINYIREHYQESINLKQLAALCNLSTSHFIYSFKKYVNCTPHEYLLLHRLRKSKQLLLTTDFSIERIAEECGFNSASHFARSFRQNNHMTPSEFRNIPF